MLSEGMCMHACVHVCICTASSNLPQLTFPQEPPVRQSLALGLWPSISSAHFSGPRMALAVHQSWALHPSLYPVPICLSLRPRAPVLLYHLEKMNPFQALLRPLCPLNLSRL